MPPGDRSRLALDVHRSVRLLRNRARLRYGVVNPNVYLGRCRDSWSKRKRKSALGGPLRMAIRHGKSIPNFPSISGTRMSPLWRIERSIGVVSVLSIFRRNFCAD